MSRQRPAIGTPLVRARLCRRRIDLVGHRFIRGNDLLGIFDRQKQLIGIELLRAAAELRPLQLPQQMAKPINLGERLVALGDGGIALGARHHDQRLQRFNVGRKLGRKLVHARH